MQRTARWVGGKETGEMRTLLSMRMVIMLWVAMPENSAFAFLPPVVTVRRNYQPRLKASGLAMSAPLSSGPAEAQGPSLLAALWGIATKGSPWEYMLDMRDAGYDGVVPVQLGPLGKYNFLLSPEAVKAVTVEEASALPLRFSVPLFKTLELDKGLVYEQGARHKRHKKICIPSFEQSLSMEAFVGATRAELDQLSARFADSAKREEQVDLYAEMRASTLNVVLAVTFGLGLGSGSSFARADLLSSTIGEYLEKIVGGCPKVESGASEKSVSECLLSL